MRARSGRIGNRSRTIGAVVGGLAMAAVIAIPAASSGAAVRAKKPALAPPAIIQAGKITYCSTLVTPPVTYYSKKHEPTGLIVDLGNAIAKKLGLKPVWQKVTFTDIIPGLQAGHCDAIMADLYIKPTRAKVVNFVPYMGAAESIVVKKGNPLHITGMDYSLCGLKVAAMFATTALADTQAQSKACVKKGKKSITITQFKNPIQAFQQVALGRADAMATTQQNANYYIAHGKGAFEKGGKAFTKFTAGFAFNKTAKALQKGFTKAFHAIFNDRTYAKIFKKYKLTGQMLKKPMKNINTVAAASKLVT